MIKLRMLILCLFTLMLQLSCAVISEQVREEAEPPLPFKTLLAEADRYRGRIVILGGYILGTRNLESETIIEVLQVPFRWGEEPDLKDRSQGRFKIYHDGFLDPEVYARDRAITVAGEVTGSDYEQIGGDRIQYLKIINREIYLWPEFETRPRPYPPWPYPYYWYRYPYYPYPYWYW
ncbi:MAG: Slp family lipoprotein [Desulfobacterales bacterium]|nr:MAG: Slp family lipoprotein [Desulfobacterales bacterium]